MEKEESTLDSDVSKPAGESGSKPAGESGSETEKTADTGAAGAEVKEVAKEKGVPETEAPGAAPPGGFKRYAHLFLFPLFFVYCEVLLRALCGTGMWQNIIYPVLFGLSFGFVLGAVTSVFPCKVNRIISLVILPFAAFIFTLECLIRRSYQVYMTIKAVLSGMRGVITDFGADLWRAVYTGIFVVLLFFLPFILYLILGKKFLPPVRHRVPFAFVSAAAAAALYVIGAFSALNGSAKARYGSQYEFDSSVEVFGLITGIRLDIKYSELPVTAFTVISANEDEPEEEGSAAVAAAGEDTADPAKDPAADSEAADAAKDTAADSAAEGTQTSGASAGDAIAGGVYERSLVDFSCFGENIMDLDLEARIESDTDAAIKEIDTYVNSLTASSKNAYTGLFEGKNLIMICAEAYCDTFVSEELTPTLYRMIHNGFYFSEYYQPAWGGSTSTGEFSMLVGLAPLDSSSTILEVRDHNLYFTLGNQLQREGYFSAAYHNGTYTFYSRNLTHQNLGYSTFTALGNGLIDITGEDWPSDELMFDKTMDIYMSSQPFSVYYMTIDGHCTYDADNGFVTEYLDRVIEATGGIYKDTTNYYICYQMGLEKALTTMIEKLEEAGIADDTVICLTGDHYPYGLAESSTFNNYEDYLKDLLGDDYNTAGWKRDHSSLIIWSGCLENEYEDLACEISSPTYSLDIVPTLSNLFGLEYDSRLLVGRDVFSDADPLVLWADYSWVTEKGKYNSSTGIFTPDEDESAEGDWGEYVERINIIVKNKLMFSQAVVDTDYYGLLFGEDDVG